MDSSDVVLEVKTDREALINNYNNHIHGTMNALNIRLKVIRESKSFCLWLGLVVVCLIQSTADSDKTIK